MLKRTVQLLIIINYSSGINLFIFNIMFKTVLIQNYPTVTTHLTEEN
jgi:hypothetical protein